MQSQLTRALGPFSLAGSTGVAGWGALWCPQRATGRLAEGPQEMFT